MLGRKRVQPKERVTPGKVRVGKVSQGGRQWGRHLKLSEDGDHHIGHEEWLSSVEPVHRALWTTGDFLSTQKLQSLFVSQ